MTYQDKLGVYRVGDLKFYSKLEAIEMHAKTGIHPHWDFNEAVYSSYDWTIEPSESLLDLYHRRAEQIRNKYDYVVLMFSGGADSTTVLESFLTNGLHIDEIASFQNHSVTGDHNSFLSAEITRVARPKIELLKEKYPWLKHRILDLGPMEIEYFSSTKGRDWLYEINSILCPSGVARESLGLKVKEWRDIIDSGKKLCILYGSDKPRVSHKNGRYVFNFLDIFDNTCTVKSMAGQQPYTDELFFWSPDLPEICIKQAHMVKRYLSQPNIETAPFITLEKTSVACTVKNSKTYWLTTHGMHTIVYPNWDITTFSVGKANDIMLTPRDEWLFNLSDTHSVKQGWEIGKKKLLETLPDYWKNDLTNWAKGVKGCISKNYYLE
jgi:hypothetical protein